MTEDLSPAIRLAAQFRQAGLRVQLYAEQRKFKAKMSYADKLGAPFVVFLGEDEIRENVVTCKDMASGEQTKLDCRQTLDRILSTLRQRQGGAIILDE